LKSKWIGFAKLAKKGLIETWDVLKSLQKSSTQKEDKINRNMGCIEISDRKRRFLPKQD